MRLSIRGSVLLCATAAIALSAGAAKDEEFKPLVKGDDPTQFELVGINEKTLTIKDGEIQVSGKPNGYFATKESYKNYVLKFEWMYERPANLASDDKFNGNSGLLLNIQGEPHVWPKSIEFQLMYKEVGKIYPIGGSKFEGKWDSAAHKKARKPVGEWNEEVVSSENGEMTCSLNGVEVTRGKNPSPDHGPIGWQSEGAPIRFRKIMIKTTN
ncbi:MAG: hypothetical protein NVSMB14_10640 [Isosphaeraceae bacterium]